MLAASLCPKRIIDRAYSQATSVAFLTLLLLATESVETARGQGPNSTESRTEAAVITADNAWELAEESVDVARCLAPSGVSFCQCQRQFE
jgi:hypothetical protein